MKWLISTNSKMYDHVSALDEFGYIDWRQKVNYEVGDIVYIYATKPYMKVMFKTVVRKINMSFDEIQTIKSIGIISRNTKTHSLVNMHDWNE